MTRTEAATSTDAGLVNRRPILIALMLTMGLAALDSTIVATAIPQIVSNLGGFSLFPWVFSIYLLTQAVTVPIYGRLADLFGRKPIMFVGIAIFLLGSVLSGMAWSMITLVVFRGVQGIGAGAIAPMTTTIAADIYTLEERGRIQGYISGVWAIASIVGPAVGGVFAQYWTWRGIFYLNIPVGLAGVFMLQRNLRENVVRRTHRIDYLGAGVLTAGLSILILALLEGGVHWSWTSTTSLGLFAASAVLIALFAWVERRAAEPIMPPWVFSSRILFSCNMVAISLGAILIGQSSYVPTYAQGVVGVGAVLAGFSMASMGISWPAAASRASRLYLKIDFRNTALIGSVFTITGCVLFATIVQENSGLWRVAAAGLVTGMGMGLTATAVIVAVQSVVPWNRRGVATGANMFTRSLGSAVGIAVFGSIANTTLADRFRHPPASLAGQLPKSVDSASLAFAHSGHSSPQVIAYTRDALFAAVHGVFWALVGASVLGLLMQLLMPKKAEQLIFSDDAPVT